MPACGEVMIFQYRA